MQYRLSTGTVGERPDAREGHTGITGLLPTIGGVETHLCHVMERMCGNAEGDRTTIDGSPWITPVIGSGCLGIGDRIGPNGEEVALGVIKVLGDLPNLGRDPDRDSTVRRFVCELFNERSGSTLDHPESPVNATEVEPWVAVLALVCARLTTFYHLVLADNLTPMSRWERDVAVYTKPPSGFHIHTVGIDSNLIQPLLSDIVALEGLLREHDDDNEAKSLIYNLISAIKQGIGDSYARQRRLERVNLTLLTELSWYVFTSKWEAYKGWTDLLVGMIMEFDSRDWSIHPPRPLITNVTITAEKVGSLLRNSAESSLKHRSDSGMTAADLAKEEPDSRYAFYDSIAQLLEAQAATVAKYREVDDRPIDLPPSVAFITSFDLELEMAMWHRGSPFTVVYPIHVQLNGSPSAVMAWLRVDITPNHKIGADYFEQIASGAQCGVLSSESLNLDRDLGLRPMIVRASGSPLMSLPDLDGSMKEDLARLGTPYEQITGIYHCAVIDEYTALQLARSQLDSISGETSSAGQAGAALPRALTTGTVQNPRFWLAMGAQLSDPAIRTLLFSHIADGQLARSAHAGPPAGAPGSGVVSSKLSSDTLPTTTPRSTGVSFGAPDPSYDSPVDEQPTGRALKSVGLVVNRHFDPSEALLLSWLGFKAVAEDCGRFIPEILHCARHAANPTFRARPNFRCQVDGLEA